MDSREKALSAVRMLHVAFLTTIFLFILMTRFAAPSEQPVAQEIVLAVAVAAVADIGVGFTMRKRFMERASEAIAREGQQRALAAWRVANIYSFAHAETVMLFGFVLKFLGASWKIAGPFFFVGFALLLLWTPRMDLPISPSENPSPAPPPPAR